MSLLTWVAARVAGGPVTYLVLVLPALILLGVAPKPTLRHGYRWVAVWAVDLHLSGFDTDVAHLPGVGAAAGLDRVGRTLRLRPALNGRIGVSLPGRDARPAR